MFDSAASWTTACQALLSSTISWSFLKLMSIEFIMLSTHLILCHFLLLPSIFPNIRVFSNELALRIRCPKHWSFSISPSKEYSGLISFRMDWLDLLAVQGTLKSLPQHHSPKASVLWDSAFFTVQLSHPYMTTGKAICYCCSVPQSCPTLCNAMDCSTPAFPVLHLLALAQIHVH